MAISYRIMIGKDGKFLVEREWYDGTKINIYDTIEEAKEYGKIYEHLGFPYDRNLGCSSLHKSCKNCSFDEFKPCTAPEMKELQGLTMVEDIRG